MKIFEENNRLIIKFEQWEWITPRGKKLFSMIKNIPHKQGLNQFSTNTCYSKYLSEIFYYPFTKKEYEEGERQFNEFMNQFNYESPF